MMISGQGKIVAADGVCEVACACNWTTNLSWDLVAHMLECRFRWFCFCMIVRQFSPGIVCQHLQWFFGRSTEENMCQGQLLWL